MNNTTDIELTLSQKFFIEQIKIEMANMTKEQLQGKIVELITLQYLKDKMWLTLLN